MTIEEVDAIMKEADLNEDGRLDYSEVDYHIPMSCDCGINLSACGVHVTYMWSACDICVVCM